jgi:polyisoprenoid-binding protein YceI
MLSKHRTKHKALNTNSFHRPQYKTEQKSAKTSFYAYSSHKDIIMKLFAIPLTAAFLAVSACSQAAPNTSEPAPTPPAKATEAAPAKMERIGNWLVVKSESHVNFTASLQGKDFTGGFDTFDAVINFKEDAVEDASVTATIHLASVSAGDKERDAALPGKEWFNIKSFPKAVFQSDNFVKTGDGQYEARGTLSMKGKSQPLTLPFTLDIDGSRAEMDGKVTLDRTLWDVGTGNWSTDEWASTKVLVDVKIVAESPL